MYADQITYNFSSTVSCLEVNTNGTSATKEPSPPLEPQHPAEKEVPSPQQPQHAPTPPVPERAVEKDKEKVDRDKSGGM